MAQDTPSRDLDKVIVRLPDGMRDRLRLEAEANLRSMNAEIVARLSDSLDPKKQREPILYVASQPEIVPGNYDLGDAITRLEKVMAKLRTKMPESEASGREKK